MREKKEKKPRQYLDRGWPHGLVRIDKKRKKVHNDVPKKFRYKENNRIQNRR